MSLSKIQSAKQAKHAKQAKKLEAKSKTNGKKNEHPFLERFDEGLADRIDSEFREQDFAENGHAVETTRTSSNAPSDPPKSRLDGSAPY